MQRIGNKVLRRAWDFSKDFLYLNLGMAIYMTGWTVFLLPYKIPTGGWVGACSILYYATGFPISLAVLIGNGILLSFALWQLGWKFTLKTGYAVISMAFFLEIGQRLMMGDDGQLIQILGPNESTMACVLGALINGLGVGLCFLSGGVTGGWDILAAIVNKYKPISFGRVLLYLDLMVIGTSYFVFKDWRPVVFGYVTLFVYTYAADMIINSAKQDVQLIIMTQKGELLARIIREHTGHTMTQLNGEGCYSHAPMNVMILMVHRHEQINVLRLIQTVDPAAFVSSSRVEGVYGLGFNRIK
ncbi:MAG: YitT family protein [Bacteroidaceae bacterium]|nr:YitT family protein [Bacteroidaceae bacterium]MBR1790064.1 YitT family protein [Bacteroidaceae bacterium]